MSALGKTEVQRVSTMTQRRIGTVFVLVLLAVGWLNRSASQEPKAPAGPAPQYTKDKELKRPTDYRTWVFVGANLGLSYSPKVADNTPREKDRHKKGEMG